MLTRGIFSWLRFIPIEAATMAVETNQESRRVLPEACWEVNDIILFTLGASYIAQSTCNIIARLE